MTKQEIFDKVAMHLLTQRFQSKSKDGKCKYRGPFGLKCAIGCLIPNDLYSPDMEGRLAHNYKVGIVLEKCGIDYTNSRLLLALQEVHDICPVSEWMWELANVADKFKLSTQVFR